MASASAATTAYERAQDQRGRGRAGILVPDGALWPRMRPTALVSLGPGNRGWHSLLGGFGGGGQGDCDQQLAAFYALLP